MTPDSRHIVCKFATQTLLQELAIGPRKVLTTRQTRGGVIAASAAHCTGMWSGRERRVVGKSVQRNVPSIKLASAPFVRRARPLVASAAGISAATSSAFGDLGVHPEFCSALDAVGVREPNALQQRTIPAILGRESLILGAQTGSGILSWRARSFFVTR